MFYHGFVNHNCLLTQEAGHFFSIVKNPKIKLRALNYEFQLIVGKGPFKNYATLPEWRGKQNVKSRMENINVNTFFSEA